MSTRSVLINIGALVAAAVVLLGAGADASGPAGAATIAQSSAVTLIGSVVDAQLTPLAGVTLTLERDGRVQATATSDRDGKFRFPAIAPGNYRVRADLKGFPQIARDVTVPPGVKSVQLPLVLVRAQDERVATSAPPPPPAPVNGPTGQPSASGGRAGGAGAGMGRIVGGVAAASPTADAQYIQIVPPQYPWYSTESYDHVPPNRFQSTAERPLSTFGADVDTASYSNVRRFLSQGQLPPSDAVRIEELVNYFHFGYAAPRDGRPVAITTEIGDCPWAPAHKLVLIGARARSSSAREIEGRNLVLLVDVSGSMAPPERLPMIRTALGMFVDTLRPDDRIAIVTYAGTSGVALPPTPAREREVIQRAIGSLSAGGSTNGGQGLILAYRLARQSFIPGGVNRVILATDGDFNVGLVNQTDLLRLIEHERDSGVFLSVFGVGTGNLKDSTMEMLADKGNGHYAYLDSLQEARRVLIHEGDATLETVAKDVKFQVEFNPAMVGAWKLIGYENRRLAARDFNDDRKDAGEMGAGHTVTVLYEIIPAGASVPEDDRAAGRPEVDPLKYQARPAVIRQAPDPAHAGEWLTVKVRYKQPEGEESALVSQPLRDGARPHHLPFASAVAEFGLLLRDAPNNVTRWDALSRRLARLEIPGDLREDAAGFKELVSIAAGLARLR